MPAKAGARLEARSQDALIRVPIARFAMIAPFTSPLTIRGTREVHRRLGHLAIRVGGTAIGIPSPERVWLAG